MIKVKTEAKTVKGVLQAIIASHFVVNWEDMPDYVRNHPGVAEGSAVYLTKEAVEYILANFDVTPKKGNEFGLEVMRNNEPI